MKKSRSIAVALSILTLGWVIWFFQQRLNYADRYVTTDDAQLDGIIIPIRANASGIVDHVAVSDNAAVRPGDLLVQFRDRETSEHVVEGQAEYEALLFAAGKGRGKDTGPGSLDSQARAAMASTKSAEASIEQMQASLANARTEYERALRLSSQRMATAESLEAALARVDALQHGVEAARSNSQAAYQGALAQKAQLKSQDFKIEAASARVLIAKEQWSNARIAAPRAGVVSRKAVEPGQFVLAGQQMMSLTSLDEVWVVANLKETDVGRVRIGQAAQVTFDAYPAHALKGLVQSIGPATGAKFSLLPQENATGNFTKVVQRVPVKVVLIPDDKPEGLVLRPGLSAFVEICTADGV